MAADEVFKMSNPNSTCTAAALTWVYMVLSGTTTPAAHQFLPQDTTLRANMRNIEDDDGNPERQSAIMGFEIVKNDTNSAKTSTEIAEIFKNNAPHVGIFWNSFHTVGYHYGHHNKQYFDNNVGLYKAKYTKDIVAKMEQVRKDERYGLWQGYEVLKLKPRLRLI